LRSKTVLLGSQCPVTNRVGLKPKETLLERWSVANSFSDYDVLGRERPSTSTA